MSIYHWVPKEVLYFITLLKRWYYSNLTNKKTEAEEDQKISGQVTNSLEGRHMTIVSSGILTPNALSTNYILSQRMLAKYLNYHNCCLQWYCCRNEFTPKKMKTLAFFLFPIYYIPTFRFELLAIQLKSCHCKWHCTSRKICLWDCVTGWYKQVHITESSKVFIE